MAKINTHGLHIIGLRKAAGNTSDYAPYSGHRDQIFFNLETGEIWTHYIYGNGYNVYDDPAIIRIIDTTEHLTMQQLADLVFEKVKIIAADDITPDDDYRKCLALTLLNASYE